VAGGDLQIEGGGVGVDVGVQLQEGLVDAAQLLGAEVAVVDDARRLAVLGEGQGGRPREVGVRQLARSRSGWLVAPEERAEAGGPVSAACVAELEKTSLRLPEVGVRCLPALGQRPEPRRVVVEVALPLLAAWAVSRRSRSSATKRKIRR
jgi:hypothetical protein